MSHARSHRIDHAFRRWLSLTVILLSTLTTGTIRAADEPTEPLERILETAHAFLADSLKTDASVETRIEIGQLDSRLRLARCARAPTAELAPGARTGGNGTVNVRCSEPVAWSIFVPFRVERYTEVVTVARPLSRQQVIQPADVRLKRLETSQLARGYFQELAPVIGLEARRALVPEQVLIDAHVTQRTLVERGQQVTLFSARPGLTVRMKGEALEAGTVGQRIRVRNSSSKRIVEGYVEPSGAIRTAF
ncbi:flagella basal body P-ring formation protein FlgA [Thiocystis minor]|uniref:flagellar basal body P-ring formation chaperone FlgA n=1 Tax=Thiocystis minor TaxID=61597 RepID=UPI0019131458|nr:flagellar basal body P-ring formation chaperone FlgA [Thiocystis minor]MBK5962728.1 flagella basal body P-ring formation protein FlgA [Thiocystis minor]